MGEQKLEIIDDKLYLYTPIPSLNEGTYKRELILTKEIFQECYKKWIIREDEKNE